MEPLAKSLRKPEWLTKKISFDQSRSTDLLLKSLDVHTVCHEARCPNISECFRDRYATFLVMGNMCTRHCRFCHVDKGSPPPLDFNEPSRVALAVERLSLRHVVVTSVTRDDLTDGGARHFARVVAEIKKIPSRPSIELLIPDFQGSLRAVKTVITSAPNILGHNLETVPRLYRLRPQADYARSLAVLEAAKSIQSSLATKSALMLGLGETEDEVKKVLEDLRKVRCDLLSLGQYLRPSLKHAPVAAYIAPSRFDAYKTLALSLGFKHVESGPYVRSSYHAAAYFGS